MRRLHDARREVIEAMEPLPVESVSLRDARGLVLATPVVAPHDVPPFANSGVDGFAVIASDTLQPPTKLTVVEDVAAGAVPAQRVASGAAIRVMTGAPLPEGADAMVMVEDTSFDGGEVTIRRAATVGDHVRVAGGDFPAGQMVFAAGHRLDATAIGVLGSIGVATPTVRRRPRVAVLSTGDEVLPPDTAELRPGTIRDANRPMLVAMLEDLGVEVHDLGIVPDDARLLRSTLEEAAVSSDAVITSGGVSMGEHDLVKAVLAEIGQVDFWRVAMQPAKPFAFGFLGGTPLFGLPGNPVSVVVAFEQFVRPALLRRMGATRLFRPRTHARLVRSVDTNPEKVVFLRVALSPGDGMWTADLAGGQASNMLSALAAADAFAVIPFGVGGVGTGELVSVELFRSAESRTLAEAEDD